MMKIKLEHKTQYFLLCNTAHKTHYKEFYRKDNNKQSHPLTGSAATELDKGMTLHKAVGLNKKTITDVYNSN